jgi:tRNA A37 threonylcarbamoyladenosine synthetase subunit TsaC/SUA5/YrdC
MLEEPIMSSTLILPGQAAPETEPETIQELLKHQVELVIDGGQCGFEPTTVIDLMGETPQILRQGRGATDMLKQ